jgi:hypothetical protein
MRGKEADGCSPPDSKQRSLYSVEDEILIKVPIGRGPGPRSPFSAIRHADSFTGPVLAEESSVRRWDERVGKQ